MNLPGIAQTLQRKPLDLHTHGTSLARYQGGQILTECGWVVRGDSGEGGLAKYWMRSEARTSIGYRCFVKTIGNQDMHLKGVLAFLRFPKE